MNMARSMAGGMGGFLPNPLAEVWEPSRDFAHLKLPTSGVRCVVALSGYVMISMGVLRVDVLIRLELQDHATCYGHLI